MLRKFYEFQDKSLKLNNLCDKGEFLLVSAVIPTYNRSFLLVRAIRSVIRQTYPSLELIIIDDGSTDNTEEVVKGYSEECSFPIRYFKKTNGGCASARNKGIEVACGAFIIFLDSDDELLPNAIMSMVMTLEKSGSDYIYSPIVNVYGNTCQVIAYPAAVGEPDLFPREHFLTNNAYSCSILYSRGIFQDLRFDEELKYNEDSDFLQKVALNFKGAYLSEPVANVYHHEENKSNNREGIYSALIGSSERVLADYPAFAASLGEAAKKRILSLKGLLVEQLLFNNRIDEAKAIARRGDIDVHGRVRWSLLLNSSLPMRLAMLSTKFKDRILGFCKSSDANMMNVMHIFSVYLPTTENWCYRLIKYLPDTRLYLVGERAENETQFALSNSLSLIMPTAEWPLAPHPLIGYGTRITSTIMKKLWMRLVAHFAKRSSIIHAHFSNVGWNYLHLAEVTKTPMVISYYGYDYEYLPNRDPHWRERYGEMFRRVSMFIAEGQNGRSKLVAMGCPEEKVKVVHLGVETSNIPFYYRTKRPQELRLVQVATFTSKKGHELTVEAFVAAAKRCPGITLTLVGKDPEGIRGPLQRKIQEAGLACQVEFIDGIDFNKLHEFFRPYQLFIHPSRYGNKGDSEGGAPVVLLDAQATGLPVLATTHCDIPEEVINGKTGVLVEEGNVDALAAGIENFYWMDSAEYSGYCENARKHIEDNYDSIESGRILRDVYENIIRDFTK